LEKFSDQQSDATSGGLTRTSVLIDKLLPDAKQVEFRGRKQLLESKYSFTGKKFRKPIVKNFEGCPQSKYLDEKVSGTSSPSIVETEQKSSDLRSEAHVFKQIKYSRKVSILLLRTLTFLNLE
jgi:hypothetical protein